MLPTRKESEETLILMLHGREIESDERPMQFGFQIQ
jgi:hypothetical protein